MKKVLLIISAVFLTFLLIFTAIKYIEKNSANRHFDTYLKEHSYQEDVLSQETKYDSKMGKFYIIVYYKKYPKRKYEYHYLNNSFSVRLMKMIVKLKQQSI